MSGLKALVTGADYSAASVGTLGPYTSVNNLKGLFDLRISHEWARYNHADPDLRPCLVNRAALPTYASGHVTTTAAGQITFPDGPLHNADNTIFAVFELHRAGGAIPQSPFGISLASPNLRGQLLFANGPNFLRLYTYTRSDPANFLAAGTQRFASYTIPVNGSLDNVMVFAVGVLRNGAGLDLYLPGVNNAAPVGTLSLTGSDLFFCGAEAAQNNFHDLRYKTSAYIGSTEKTRLAGYAHRALSLSEINQLHTDVKAYYTGLGLSVT